jgi:hypothetical protein
MDEPDRPSLLRRLARRFVVRREPPGPAAYPPLAVEVESHLVGVRWPDDHTLQLHGWVYRPGFPATADNQPGLAVRLEDPERETVAEALVSPYAEPAVNVEADDARHLGGLRGRARRTPPARPRRRSLDRGLPPRP